MKRKHSQHITFICDKKQFFIHGLLCAIFKLLQDHYCLSYDSRHYRHWSYKAEIYSHIQRNSALLHAIKHSVNVCAKKGEFTFPKMCTIIYATVKGMSIRVNINNCFFAILRILNRKAKD